ncbi:transglutaminase domain-containing protein [Ruminococcus albus]|uniref:Transglutaminase-like superfamily protein n=1 Tax=Ruminococcus albus TaxID=1264 RepID=A0A1I1DDE5_RUMAL|nr:transglutaminase domain-containing protein [Ruminococcus albus]SFB71078.1 Transglutaminase-like superfamily protein [Ruminococcus albus]
MKKALFPMLAAALMLSGCGFSDIKEAISEKVDEKIEAHSIEKSSYTQEQVNEKIYKELAECKRKIVFDGVVSTEMVQNAVYGARYDRPDVFWTGGFTVSTDYSTTTLECDSIHDLDEKTLAEMKADMDRSLDKVVKEASEGAADFDKLLLLHDKLIEICDYDYDAAKATDSENIGFAGSSYGCLVEHKAVCEGYAQAFSLAAQKMGFECGMVCGMARNEKHAWNYVKIDGEYYWLDVTWDENATESEFAYVPMHKYFMLDDSRLMKDRTVEEDVPFVPVCSSMDENYYVKSGLYLESYSFDQVNSLLNEHYEDGGLDIMFANMDSYDEAVEDLMKNGSIWNTDVMKNNVDKKPGYFPDEDKFGILTISIE